jgi:hypothetical protein
VIFRLPASIVSGASPTISADWPRGFVKFGTVDATEGLGSGKTDVGVEGVFSSQLPWIFRAAVMHTSLGLVWTGDPGTPQPLVLNNQLRSGLGVAYPSAQPIQGIFEYTTNSFIGSGSLNAAALDVQNANDISAGIRYLMLDRGVTFDGGYRLNTKFDRKFPDNRDGRGFVSA